jgi:hypothetical protein
VCSPVRSRVEEHCRRRIAATERAIVAHIGPQSTLARLVLGQDRHRRVVAVHPLPGEHMRADQIVQRPQQRGARAARLSAGRRSLRTKRPSNNFGHAAVRVPSVS